MLGYVCEISDGGKAPFLGIWGVKTGGGLWFGCGGQVVAKWWPNGGQCAKKRHAKARFAWVFLGRWRIVLVLGALGCAGVLFGARVRKVCLGVSGCLCIRLVRGRRAIPLGVRGAGDEPWVVGGAVGFTVRGGEEWVCPCGGGVGYG